MKMRDRNDERPDPLLERLRALPSEGLDDVTSARTLARAEAVLPDRGGSARGREARAATPRFTRWVLSAALLGWGTLYVWGAVDALTRLFPMKAATTTVAVLSRSTIR